MSDPLVTTLLDLLRPEVERLVEQLVAERLAALPAPEPSRWLTVREAAAYVRLSEPALRARARRGSVPGYLDEGRWIFDRVELDEHLRSSEPGPATLQEVITTNGRAPLERPRPGNERLAFDARAFS